MRLPFSTSIVSSIYQLVSALASDASVQSPDLLRGVYNKETLLA